MWPTCPSSLQLQTAEQATQHGQKGRARQHSDHAALRWVQSYVSRSESRCSVAGACLRPVDVAPPLAEGAAA